MEVLHCWNSFGQALPLPFHTVHRALQPTDHFLALLAGLLELAAHLSNLIGRDLDPCHSCNLLFQALDWIETIDLRDNS